MVRFTGALVCAGSLALAQGVLEPRHVLSVSEVGENRTFNVVGDVNGDGCDDLVIADPWKTSTIFLQGFVTVFSGFDASQIWSVAGQEYQGRLGWAVSGAGDVNGDGVPDVAALEPWADGGHGRVWVYSGSTGAALHSLSNPDPDDVYNAEAVSGIADLDADGRGDFMVGHPSGNQDGARVFVYSGASGNILHTLAPPYPDALDADLFGYAVADVGDVTGDGIHDILVGEPNARNPANPNEVVGAVYLFSGATGSFVYAIWGVGSGSGFGRQVDGVGDQDGDGRADFIVAGEQFFRSKVFSGASRALLWSGGYGTLASGAGDVNGDGIEDFMVGYGGGPSTWGGFYVVSGGTFTTWYSGLHYPGGTDGPVNRAGDINHDGFADFMVGDFFSDRISVHLGRPAIKELRRVEGGSAQDWAGFAVSGAGDVDADGFDDVIVGVPKDDIRMGVVDVADAGSARVLSGFDGRTLIACQGSVANDLLGFSVSGAGDVNKDGFDDVIVGVPTSDLGGTLTDAGEARVYSGRDGSELRRLPGPSAGAHFGLSVSDAGDVNGDGYADVIVGAPYDDIGPLVDVGAATVYSGADWSELYRWTGAAASDDFGYSVSGAGDVDGDGRADLVVGAYGSDDANGANTGSVTVYSGFDGLPIFTHHGSAAGDFLGFSVSGAGDVNKDGLADVVVGAKQVLVSAGGSGYARVLSGPTGTLLYQFDADGGLNVAAGDGHQLLGYSVSGAGDVNGDGYDDVIIGAPIFGIAGSGNFGCARVHSGLDGGVLLYQLQGDASNHPHFGNAVSAAGDVNGDGRPDVIVGAYLRDSGGLTDSGAAFVYSLGYPGETPKRRKGQAPPGPVITFP